jgi:hypothetical protein
MNDGNASGQGAAMEQLSVEPDGGNDTGLCGCCGNRSRCVWGFVRSPAGPVAAYFVNWTLGRVPDHGASFDLILGRWGEGTSAEDRVAVALAYRLLEGGPAFMVIDAGGRPAAGGGLAGRALFRDEVVGLPVAGEAFAVVDAVLVQDARVAELLEG